MMAKGEALTEKEELLQEGSSLSQAGWGLYLGWLALSRSTPLCL